MVKLYGIDLSTWSNAARFTANALGLDYEYEQVDLMNGAGQTPEYLAIHPAGKVPALTDDDFVLFESGAIQRYLARKANSNLYPSDLKAQATVDQWHAFASQHIGNAMGKVLFNEVFAAAMGGERNDAELAEGRGFLDRFLPIIDAQLGKSAYLAGAELSIADLLLLAWLDPVELVSVDLSPYPNIVAWRAKLRQEDFYTKCYSDYKSHFEMMMSAAA